MTTLAQVNEDFDRLFGDTWQPTMPAKPPPLDSPVNSRHDTAHLPTGTTP